MPVVTGWRAEEVDVAVVGAGAAGLAAARHLSTRPGLSVLVLEAASRIGGRSHTRIPPSVMCPIDLGCGWLHAGRTNIWRHVAEDLGFTVDRRPAPWDEGTVELGLSADEAQDYEAVVAAFYARAEAAAAAGDDRALGALLEPGCRWRGLLDAVSTFVSGVELDRVSVRDHVDYQPGSGPDWRIVEGYGQLIARFGAPVPVLLETPVTQIDHRAKERIRLETPRGVLSARAVIVTVSTDVLAGGAIDFLPALPDKIAAAARLPLGLADKVFFEVAPQAGLPSESYRLGDPRQARTAAYHLRPFGRPVIEVFFGGTLARDLEAGGAEAAVDFAAAELSGHFGSTMRHYLSPLHVTAWGREPFIGGSYAYAVPGAAGSREVLAAPVDDRLFFAGEACSPSAYTTAHGAYETGFAAAQASLASVSGS